MVRLSTREKVVLITNENIEGRRDFSLLSVSLDLRLERTKRL